MSTLKRRVPMAARLTKQQAQASAECMGHLKGVRNYKKYHIGPFNDVPLTGNSFHRGSRCWYAYERGYYRAWMMTARDIAFKETAQEEAEKFGGDWIKGRV